MLYEMNDKPRVIVIGYLPYRTLYTRLDTIQSSTNIFESDYSGKKLAKIDKKYTIKEDDVEKEFDLPGNLS